MPFDIPVFSHSNRWNRRIELTADAEWRRHRHCTVVVLARSLGYSSYMICFSTMCRKTGQTIDSLEIISLPLHGLLDKLSFFLFKNIASKIFIYCTTFYLAYRNFEKKKKISLENNVILNINRKLLLH